MNIKDPEVRFSANAQIIFFQFTLMQQNRIIDKLKRMQPWSEFKKNMKDVEEFESFTVNILAHTFTYIFCYDSFGNNFLIVFRILPFIPY